MIEYTPPTPEEFRLLLAKWELTGAKAGDMVNIKGRQIRKYTGGQAPIPYAALFVLFAKNDGIFIAKDWRNRE